jgi:acetyl/propionyl-CoA carboxylase alpha subunit
MQRRNQKMIEESAVPAPVMNPKLRGQMGEAAKAAVRAAATRTRGPLSFSWMGTADFTLWK